jgi:hypothetical protein
MKRTVAAAAVLWVACASPDTTPFDAGQFAYPPLDGGALNPVPRLDALQPSGVEVGAALASVTLQGVDFLPGCQVLWNGAVRPAQRDSATQLTVTLTADDVLVPRGHQVEVVNPAPGGGPSRPAAFTVTGASPAPRLEGLAPDTVNAGAAALTLTVRGGNFTPASVVQLDGADRPTHFTSTVQLTAEVSAADLASPGAAVVRVRTPAPGGGQSGPATLTVQGTASGLLRVSLAEDGGELTANVDSVAVSSEGRFVAFTTNSPAVADDTNGRADVFVRDTCLGAAACTPSTVRVSLSADGGQLARGSGLRGLSSQGRFVLFDCDDPAVLGLSTGNNPVLVLRDTCRGAASCTPTNFPITVLVDGGVRDTCAGQGPGCTASTQRASVASDGGQRQSGGFDAPALSNDGRFVAFASNDDTLTDDDTSPGVDFFVRDTCRGAAFACTPTTVRATVGPQGEPLLGASTTQPALSGDGRVLSFTTRAALGVAKGNADYDVFARDTCLGAVGACTPSTRVISLALDGGVTGAQGSFMYGPRTLSTTGRYQAFLSSANDLTLDDPGNDDVFVRDTCLGVSAGCTPRTRLVSQASGGTPQNARAASRGPAMTPDGRWVVFISEASNLVADDTNGVRDAFIVAPGFSP